MNDKCHVKLVLNNIRSNHNVGSILRTADAIGVEEVCLVGVTPTPIDRFGRPIAAIAKTALGAERSVVWEHAPTLSSVVGLLKKEGYSVVGIEQDARAIDYKVYEPKEKVAVVLGPEVEGFSKEELALCDDVLEIPMNGTKESLNVSVAAGIVLYRLFDNDGRPS